jgi:hypothetical protein
MAMLDIDAFESEAYMAAWAKNTITGETDLELLTTQPGIDSATFFDTQVNPPLVLNPSTQQAVLSSHASPTKGEMRSSSHARATAIERPRAFGAGGGGRYISVQTSCVSSFHVDAWLNANAGDSAGTAAASTTQKYERRYRVLDLAEQQEGLGQVLIASLSVYSVFWQITSTITSQLGPKVSSRALRGGCVLKAEVFADDEDTGMYLKATWKPDKAFGGDVGVWEIEQKLMDECGNVVGPVIVENFPPTMLTTVDEFGNQVAIPYTRNTYLTVPGEGVEANRFTIKTSINEVEDMDSLLAWPGTGGHKAELTIPTTPPVASHSSRAESMTVAVTSKVFSLQHEQHLQARAAAKL